MLESNALQCPLSTPPLGLGVPWPGLRSDGIPGCSASRHPSKPPSSPLLAILVQFLPQQLLTA